MIRNLFIISLLSVSALVNAAEYKVSSPDGKVEAKVVNNGNTTYSLSYDGQALIVDSPLSVTLSDGLVWGTSKVRKASTKSVNEPIQATFYRKSVVENAYNELNLDYGKYNLVFRAYNDGFAWRWESDARTPYKVNAEQATFNFAQDWNMYATYTHKYDWDFSYDSNLEAFIEDLFQFIANNREVE